ncbi:hypothetical protein PIB30_012958 [Stylosanthes scabra]|uniref:Uncharacterized protein n=1 Tax=Stylosanthes scabra TaxID=79078 RepID=A0ABU6Z4U2_9FABA|nr:hypothetical protein [Stylosanthes scabra]
MQSLGEASLGEGSAVGHIDADSDETRYLINEQAVRGAFEEDNDAISGDGGFSSVLRQAGVGDVLVNAPSADVLVTKPNCLQGRTLATRTLSVNRGEAGLGIRQQGCTEEVEDKANEENGEQGQWDSLSEELSDESDVDGGVLLPSPSGAPRIEDRACTHCVNGDNLANSASLSDETLYLINSNFVNESRRAEGVISKFESEGGVGEEWESIKEEDNSTENLAAKEVWCCAGLFIDSSEEGEIHSKIVRQKKVEGKRRPDLRPKEQRQVKKPPCIQGRSFATRKLMSEIIETGVVKKHYILGEAETVETDWTEDLELVDFDQVGRRYNRYDGRFGSRIGGVRFQSSWVDISYHDMDILVGWLI